MIALLNPGSTKSGDCTIRVLRVDAGSWSPREWLSRLAATGHRIELSQVTNIGAGLDLVERAQTPFHLVIVQAKGFLHSSSGSHALYTWHLLDQLVYRHRIYRCGRGRLLAVGEIDPGMEPEFEYLGVPVSARQELDLNGLTQEVHDLLAS